MVGEPAGYRAHRPCPAQLSSARIRDGGRHPMPPRCWRCVSEEKRRPGLNNRFCMISRDTRDEGVWAGPTEEPLTGEIVVQSYLLSRLYQRFTRMNPLAVHLWKLSTARSLGSLGRLTGYYSNVGGTPSAGPST